MADEDQDLRAAGLRRTPARLAVLRHVRIGARPVSHAALSAAPELADIDDITLYRTLSALERAGLVHRVYGVDGVWRYGANDASEGCPGNHAHFLCTRCGAMECLPDQPMPRLQVPAGTRVDGRHLLGFGACAACAGRAEATAHAGAAP
jgi:Fur family ferric uptake transcriptional regulator